MTTYANWFAARACWATRLRSRIAVAFCLLLIASTLSLAQERIDIEKETGSGGKESAFLRQPATGDEAGQRSTGCGTSGQKNPGGQQSKQAPSSEREFLRDILRDQRAIWTSPAHIGKGDVKWVVLFAAATGALIATDEETGEKLPNTKDQLVISRNVSRLGSGYTTLGTAGVLYVVGRLTHQEKIKQTGLLAAEALTDSGIVTGVLKLVTARERPNKRRGAGRFWEGGTSFPSGHAANIWALSTVVAEQYGSNRRWVRFGAYGLATAVSVSRFTARQHHLSDVLVGSLLGYGIGQYVVRARGLRTRHLVPDCIAPRFDQNTRTYGVSVSWNF